MAAAWETLHPLGTRSPVGRVNCWQQPLGQWTPQANGRSAMSPLGGLSPNVSQIRAKRVPASGWQTGVQAAPADSAIAPQKTTSTPLPALPVAPLGTLHRRPLAQKWIADHALQMNAQSAIAANSPTATPEPTNTLETVSPALPASPLGIVHRRPLAQKWAIAGDRFAESETAGTPVADSPPVDYPPVETPPNPIETTIQRQIETAKGTVADSSEPATVPSPSTTPAISQSSIAKAEPAAAISATESIQPQSDSSPPAASPAAETVQRDPTAQLTPANQTVQPALESTARGETVQPAPAETVSREADDSFETPITNISSDAIASTEVSPNLSRQAEAAESSAIEPIEQPVVSAELLTDSASSDEAPAQADTLPVNNAESPLADTVQQFSVERSPQVDSAVPESAATSSETPPAQTEAAPPTAPVQPAAPEPPSGETESPSPDSPPSALPIQSRSSTELPAPAAAASQLESVEAVPDVTDSSPRLSPTTDPTVTPQPLAAEIDEPAVSLPRKATETEAIAAPDTASFAQQPTPTIIDANSDAGLQPQAIAAEELSTLDPSNPSDEASTQALQAEPQPVTDLAQDITATEITTSTTAPLQARSESQSQPPTSPSPAESIQPQSPETPSPQLQSPILLTPSQPDPTPQLPASPNPGNQPLVQRSPALSPPDAHNNQSPIQRSPAPLPAQSPSPSLPSPPLPHRYLTHPLGTRSPLQRRAEATDEPWQTQFNLGSSPPATASWQDQFQLEADTEAEKTTPEPPAPETAIAETAETESDIPESSVEAIAPASDSSTPPIPGQRSSVAIGEGELEILARVMYSLLRSRLEIEQEFHYGRSTSSSLWIDQTAPCDWSDAAAKTEAGPGLSQPGQLWLELEANSLVIDKNISDLYQTVYALYRDRFELLKDRQPYFLSHSL
ncbi:MAG: hypothetical protein F6K04_14940 [Leptolyngbya sp. SIO4C5]|nr:hypothetical protein [Leptolyngbya sp. SIO4C5]